MIEAFSYAALGAIAVITGVIVYQLASNAMIGTVLSVKRELDNLRKENQRCYTTIEQLRESLQSAVITDAQKADTDLLITAYAAELDRFRASNADLRSRNEALHGNFSAALGELKFQNELVAKYCDPSTEMKIKMAQAGYLDGGKSTNISSKADNDV